MNKILGLMNKTCFICNKVLSINSSKNISITIISHFST